MLSENFPRGKKLKILMVATEAAPYVNVGGFASVVGYLSRELIRLGHDVRIFIPKFGSIEEGQYGIRMLIEGLRVPVGGPTQEELICNVKVADGEGKKGAITYFLENQEYYEKRANVYGYNDDPTRFALLSRGVLEFIRRGEFVPDVLHCNDWHTGIVPNYLKTAYKEDALLNKIATVFTIHNLNFQGIFDHRHVSELDYDDGRSQIAPFFSSRLGKQNFMRRGILYADAVNTVSRTYAKEILTPEFGEGLDKLLSELRSKLFGIVDGIDYDELNPATDPLIEKKYDINTLNVRSLNKRALQKEFDLPVNDEALVLGFVGRLGYQKGIDLLINTLHHALKDYDIQFVQVGGGDGGLVEMLHGLKKGFPSKIGIHPYPNFTLPKLVFAGADCIVYPSRFEPCGIVQLEAMRYGALPIVRRVGGLADTVENIDARRETGTGFVFNDFDEYSLFGQIIRAVELYNNKKLWRKLQKNAMRADFSWSFSAKEYLKLYNKALLFKAKKGSREKAVDSLIG